MLIRRYVNYKLRVIVKRYILVRKFFVSCKFYRNFGFVIYF